MFNLSLLYGKEGVPRDSTEAEDWLHKAAERGHPDAQNLVGAMYYYGHSVEQDDIEAEKWMMLAEERGATDQAQTFAALRSTLAARMTPSEVAKAEERTREWTAAFEKRKK